MARETKRVGTSTFSKTESYSMSERTFSGESSEPANWTDDEATIPSKGAAEETNLFIKYNPLWGLFYMFLNSVFAQLSSVIVKVLSITSIQLTLIRCIGVFVGSLPLVIYHGNRVLGEKRDRILLLFRAFSGAVAVLLTTIAYKYLPLAEAAVLISTMPVVTSCIARVYLREPCSIVLIISLLTTILGILLSVRLPVLDRDQNHFHKDSNYFGGLAAAAGAVLLYSLNTVITRKQKRVHYSVASMYFGIAGVIVTLLVHAISIPFEPLCCGWDQILCIILGVFGSLVGIFYILGIRHQPAGLAAVEKFSFEILVAVVFQIAFFNQYLDTYMICGVCLVITSLTIVGISNWLVMQPHDSNARKVLRCFLY